MATVIKVDGTTVTKLPEGTTFTLGELQAVVGGYIEAITLDRDEAGRLLTMYMDEEGLLKGLPLNHKATELAYKELAKTGRTLLPGSHICGDVIICTHAETGDDEPE